MNRLLFLFCLISFQLHANDAEPLPRMYGYVIGDVLEQRVALSGDSETVELAELPNLQRVGPWVQRLSAETTVDEEGITWLVMQYQIINAPLETKEIALPSVELPTTLNGKFLLNAQPLSISPLTTEGQAPENNLPFMMPEKTISLGDSKAVDKKLRAAMTALGITIFGWLVWWLWLQQADKTTLPFSKAMSKLRRLRRNTQQGVNDNSEAWSAVHEAFNTVAGQTLSSTTAATELNRRRWLEPFSADIQRFYRASDQRFFEPDAGQNNFELFDLCKKLYRAEKQNTIESKSVTQH